MPFERIAIIGLGMIGASFACACKEANEQIVIFGVDAASSSVETALERGWIDAGATPGDSALVDFITKGCDLIELAIPVDQARPYLDAIANCGYDGIVSGIRWPVPRLTGLLERNLRCSAVRIGFCVQMNERPRRRIRHSMTS